MPGTQTELSLGKDRKYYISKEVNYWSIREIALHGQLNTFQGTYENCKNSARVSGGLDLEGSLTELSKD